MLAGRAATAVSADAPVPEEARTLEPILRPLMGALQRALGSEEPEIYLEGASHILGQPEFRESQKVEPLVRLLEERKTAFESLRLFLDGGPLSVVIGAENAQNELKECSVIAARYEAGPHSYGWIGVIGPTRMLYDRAMPFVRYAARTLSQALSRLGRD
jgi:heat-inducible transcriptional repressor